MTRSAERTIGTHSLTLGQVGKARCGCVRRGCALHPVFVGRVVWAQPKYFPPWPARLLSSAELPQAQRSNVGVYCFGDHTTVFVAPAKIEPFAEADAAGHARVHEAKLPARLRPVFAAALAEARVAHKAFCKRSNGSVDSEVA